MEATGAGEATGAVETLTLTEAESRLPGTNEHCVPAADAGARDVEAIVHPVHEEHVGVTLLAQERAGAQGQSGAGVAREVSRPAVSLRLDYTRRAKAAISPLVHDHAAEECPCDDQGIAGVPRPVEAGRPE